MLSSKISITLILIGCCVISVFGQTDLGLQINDQEYLELPGLNVMAYHDYYAAGHQSGVTIIQNGGRVAANGDVHLWTFSCASGCAMSMYSSMLLGFIFPFVKRKMA